MSPRTPPTIPPPLTLPTPGPDGSGVWSARRPARVMVVDDYPDSATSASILLTLLGYECRTACTGREALEQAAAFEPDVVLLDIGLPDISGYEVARQLRAQHPGHLLYIAAITGWGQPEDRVRAFDAGFDQHVLKPTDAATLKMILARAATRLCAD